jgi:hypothetical protein
VRKVIFSQSRQDSFLERVVFFSVDILPAFTQWVFRQYFFGGHFPSRFLILLFALTFMSLNLTSMRLGVLVN